MTYSLIASIIGLAAVFIWQTRLHPAMPDTDGASTHSSPSLLPDAPAAIFDLATLDAYDEIIERPLFSQTRRPPEPETVKSEPVNKPKSKAEPLPDWKLVGTAITGQTQAALIWDVRNRRFVRLEQGMNQGGWELAAVRPEYIVLNKGKIQHQIKLPRF